MSAYFEFFLFSGNTKAGASQTVEDLLVCREELSPFSLSYPNLSRESTDLKSSKLAPLPQPWPAHFNSETSPIFPENPSFRIHKSPLPRPHSCSSSPGEQTWTVEQSPSPGMSGGEGSGDVPPGVGILQCQGLNWGGMCEASTACSPLLPAPS